MTTTTTTRTDALYDKLTAAETAEDVAAILAEAGITGEPKHDERCPLAQALDRTVRRGWTPATSAFLSEFDSSGSDQGAWPELKAVPLTIRNETVTVRRQCAYAKESSEVHAEAGSTVYARTGSKVHAEADSLVYAQNGSKVYARTGSKVHAEAGSEVHAEEDSMVSAGAGSKVYAETGSRVRARTGSEVYARTGSKVYAWPGSLVYPRTGSEVHAEAGSTVYAEL